MATAFSSTLGINPDANYAPKYVPVAKVVFEDGQVAIIEPKLDCFERITNNAGGTLKYIQ